jgi:DNA-binding response OmpR family regulator
MQMQRMRNNFKYNPLDHNEAGNRSQEPEDTILIVEDDDTIGELLVEVLAEETSHRTLLVTDGLQALQMIKHIKPSLLITDYRLPFMSGVELYDRLQAQKKLENTPTILMSAHLPPEEEVRKRQMIGMRKPFDLDLFLDTVESLLDRRSHYRDHRHAG